jgi:hypothetical protein
MGNLKPGATYIYERNGDEVYAREFGETHRLQRLIERQGLGHGPVQKAGVTSEIGR